MSWRRRINGALVWTTGFELRKPPGNRAAWRRKRSRPGDRLVTQPGFILCSVRSGSTLLRMLLNSHSAIHAPPELHLGDVAVNVEGKYAERWLREAGLDPSQLEYLLWDRVLHRELQGSGKQVIVNKNPTDVFVADRIRQCWPQARLIFLLRHPVAIARSRQRARPQDTAEANDRTVLRYCNAVEAARRAYPGLTVRYEELAANPATVTRRVCEFLEVRWEREMLEYGRFDHGRSGPGLGDWTENIQSGQVVPPAPLPEPGEIPDALREICAAWEYLPAEAAPQVTS